MRVWCLTAAQEFSKLLESVRIRLSAPNFSNALAGSQRMLRIVLRHIQQLEDIDHRVREHEGHVAKLNYASVQNILHDKSLGCRQILLLWKPTKGIVLDRMGKSIPCPVSRKT